jgi:hypothetical protein
MNGPLREAAVTDPKWARKEYRREWLIKAVTVGVLVALAVGVVTILQNRGQDADITNVTRKVESACAIDAGGRRCQAIKLRADEEQPVGAACVQFKKVGYPCPKPGSRIAREVHANPRAVQDLEFDSGSSPTLAPGGASEMPLPSSGDTGGVVGPRGPAKPRQPRQPKQSPSPSQPPPLAPAPIAEPSAPTDPNPDKGKGPPENAPKGQGGLLEPAGSILEGAGSVVSGATCGATGRVGLGCPR